MTDELDRYMHELLRRQRHGERLTIELGPHTALTVVGAIQWAMRQENALNVFAPAVFETFLAELRTAFADEPAALALIQAHEPGSDGGNPR